MKPALVIIAGPNGSGKTTLTRQLLRHEWLENSLYINPDEIAQKEFGGWDSPEASLQAAQKAELLREQCLVQGRNLAFETVFSAPDKLEFIKKARQVGYFIRFFFICTEDPWININRIGRRRVRGGHDVPPIKTLHRYFKSIANARQTVSLVDRAYFYDNSVEDHDPQLLFRIENGRLKKRYQDPLPVWAQPILTAIS